MYRPLPDCLTIDKSTIEGVGLFAKEEISKGVYLGITHIQTEKYNLVRTPLGGFINHSDTPNCKIKKDGNAKYLTTLVDIKSGEELTVKYTMYDPTK